MFVQTLERVIRHSNGELVLPVVTTNHGLYNYYYTRSIPFKQISYIAGILYFKCIHFRGMTVRKVFAE